MGEISHFGQHGHRREKNALIASGIQSGGTFYEPGGGGRGVRYKGEQSLCGETLSCLIKKHQVKWIIWCANQDCFQVCACLCARVFACAPCTPLCVRVCVCT